MKNKGFTLIELVIVISLIGLFIGLFSSNFYRGREQKNLISAFNHLRSFIDYTRNQSLNSLIPENCPSDSFVGYGLDFSIQNNSVLRFSHCVTGLSPLTANDTNLEKLLFSKYEHVSMVSITPSHRQIFFERATGEVIDAVNNIKTSVTIILKSTTLNQCAQITINQFGVVDEDKDISCP